LLDCRYGNRSLNEGQSASVHQDGRSEKSYAAERTDDRDEHDPAPAGAIRGTCRADLLAHGSDGLHRRLAVKAALSTLSVANG
jgi:hypothetical protein